MLDALVSPIVPLFPKTLYTTPTSHRRKVPEGRVVRTLLSHIPCRSVKESCLSHRLPICLGLYVFVGLVPVYTEATIRIDADEILYQLDPNTASLRDVRLTKGDGFLLISPRLLVERKKSGTVLRSPVETKVVLHGLTLYGTSCSYTPMDHLCVIEDVHFQWHNGAGIGSASKAILSEKTIHLLQPTFTQCTGLTPSWKWSAQQMTYALDTKQVTLHRISYKFKQLPLFFWPYLSYTYATKHPFGSPLLPLFAPQTTPALRVTSAGLQQIGLPLRLNTTPHASFSLLPSWFSAKGLACLAEAEWISPHQSKLQALFGLLQSEEEIPSYLLQLTYATSLAARIQTKSKLYLASDKGTALATTELPLLLSRDKSNRTEHRLQYNHDPMEISLYGAYRFPFPSDPSEERLFETELLCRMRHWHRRGVPRSAFIQEAATALECLYCQATRRNHRRHETKRLVCTYGYLAHHLQHRQRMGRVVSLYHLHLRALATSRTTKQDPLFVVRPAIQAQYKLPILLLQKTTSYFWHELRLQLWFAPDLTAFLPNELSLLTKIHPLPFQHEIQLPPLLARDSCYVDVGSSQELRLLDSRWLYKGNVALRKIIASSFRRPQYQAILQGEAQTTFGTLAYCSVLRLPDQAAEKIQLTYTLYRPTRYLLRCNYQVLPAQPRNPEGASSHQAGLSLGYVLTPSLALCARYVYALSYHHKLESLYGLQWKKECWYLQLGYLASLTPREASKQPHALYKDTYIVQLRWHGSPFASRPTHFDLLQRGTFSERLT